MNAPLARGNLERFGRLLAEYRKRQAKADQSQRGWYDEHGVRQGGLIAFVRYFWRVLEPSNKFVDGWPLWAMCEHLEAVTAGEITRLLITVPPGFMKSLLTDVFWPAWEWGPMKCPHYRYIAFSYGAHLTERDNDRFRQLVTHPSYQGLYGPLDTKVKSGERKEVVEGITLRNKTTLKVMNTATGWKLASSVSGIGTGERGNRVICDDLHNVKEQESETVREETVRWFFEAVSDRFNDLDLGALIIIMQRVHADDVAGAVLGKQLPYCHLMIPWEFDSSRAIDDDGKIVSTTIGWVDPRLDVDDPQAGDGEPAWPERFSDAAIERLRAEKGPYAWSGQYQQSPAPRGGGIFQRDWWQLWESPTDEFPSLEYIIASLDGAFTEDEENDPSALTIWGLFKNEQDRQRVILLNAWRKHLKFSGETVERLEVETIIDGVRHLPDIVVPGMMPAMVKARNERYRRRARPQWGLIEWVSDSCRRFKVDKLLIEAKASGISAAQELQKRHGLEGWGIQLCPVKGDKVARALSVQPSFSQGMVYAPAREWAEMVIEEMEVFPKHKHDDLTDSTTQAISHLRALGYLRSDEEAHAAEREAVRHRSKVSALYPV